MPADVGEFTRGMEELAKFTKDLRVVGTYGSG
jgi:hypothetical protein